MEKNMENEMVTAVYIRVRGGFGELQVSYNDIIKGAAISCNDLSILPEKTEA